MIIFVTGREDHSGSIFSNNLACDRAVPHRLFLYTEEVVEDDSRFINHRNLYTLGLQTEDRFGTRFVIVRTLISHVPHDQLRRLSCLRPTSQTTHILAQGNENENLQNIPIALCKEDV